MMLRRWRLSPSPRALARRNARADFATISISDERIARWQVEHERQQEELSQARADAIARAEPIELAVQQDVDGGARSFAFRGIAGVSTPIDVLKELQVQGFPKMQALAALVDANDVVDLRTPLERSGSLRLLEYVALRVDAFEAVGNANCRV